MNVPNVITGLPNLASQLKGGQASALKAAAGQAAAAVQALSPSQTAAMREVLSQYDVTDISPNDFSKVVQQLSAKGAITPQDAQQLSSIRVDLENAGIGPDEPVNLVDFYGQQLAKAQTAAAQSPNPAAAKANIDAIVGRLNWLQKFVAAHQQGGQGVNAVA